MDILFTQHALNRMDDYQILKTDVLTTVKRNRRLPRKEKHYDPRYENTHRLLGDNDLIVVIDIVVDSIKVITIFPSDKPLEEKSSFSNHPYFSRV